MGVGNEGTRCTGRMAVVGLLHKKKSRGKETHLVCIRGNGAQKRHGRPCHFCRG